MAFSDPKHNIIQFGLAPAMEVADFGAGAGYLSVEAAEEVGRDGVVYVIDIQQELLTKVTHLAQAHHLDSLVFIHGDLEAERGSTLPDDSVDAVILSNILFQSEHKDAILSEAYRVLRNGGRMLFIDWRGSYQGMGPQQEYILEENDARLLLKQAGFTHLADIDAGSFHYGMIVKKHGKK